MTKHYNLEKIRRLLTEGFTEEELLNLCFDKPALKPVYDNWAGIASRDKLARQIVDYADKKLVIEVVLEWAKEHNPPRYEEYRPYVQTWTGPIGSSQVVLIETYHEKFVNVDAAQDWLLFGSADQSTAEKFTLFYRGESKIALRSSHNRYVTAIRGKPWALRASAQDVGKTQEFTLIEMGDKRAAFRTAYDKYITAMNDEPGRNWVLRAETNKIQAWEKFTLVPIE